MRTHQVVCAGGSWSACFLDSNSRVAYCKDALRLVVSVLMLNIAGQGDLIEEFQPLCEVQSDKATVEITSRYKGKISQIIYAPGDIVKVTSSSRLIWVMLDDVYASLASGWRDSSEDDGRGRSASDWDSSL